MHEYLHQLLTRSIGFVGHVAYHFMDLCCCLDHYKLDSLSSKMVFLMKFQINFLFNGSLLQPRRQYYWTMQFVKLRIFYLLKFMMTKK